MICPNQNLAEGIEMTLDDRMREYYGRILFYRIRINEIYGVGFFMESSEFWMRGDSYV